MRFEILRQELANGAHVIPALLAGVTPGEARRKPGPVDWSILEVVCHLYDEEREDFRLRLDLMLHRPAEPWPKISPGAWVTERAYNERDYAAMLEQWLAELPGGDRGAEALPHAVLSVAGQAIRTATAEAPGEVAFARVLSTAGRWILLHGAVMHSGGGRRIAVIVEPAHPARITPLLMAAYGLTDREQDIARQVLSGAGTVEIGQALHISPHTVKEHLKSILEKTGVRSRRELVAKIFFAHYEPRLRDNEQRALTDRPLRGGPAGGPC